jgi:hypothetical protein
VIPASPAIAPEAAPRTVGLERLYHSINTHDNVAAAAEHCVLIKAVRANVPEVNALPALKPNQPNHNNAAPVKVIVKLCGGICS